MILSLHQIQLTLHVARCLVSANTMPMHKVRLAGTRQLSPHRSCNGNACLKRRLQARTTHTKSQWAGADWHKQRKLQKFGALTPSNYHQTWPDSFWHVPAMLPFPLWAGDNNHAKAGGDPRLDLQQFIRLAFLHQHGRNNSDIAAFASAARSLHMDKHTQLERPCKALPSARAKSVPKQCKFPVEALTASARRAPHPVASYVRLLRSSLCQQLSTVHGRSLVPRLSIPGGSPMR